jgi:hypothetical protein
MRAIRIAGCLILVGVTVVVTLGLFWGGEVAAKTENRGPFRIKKLLPDIGSHPWAMTSGPCKVKAILAMEQVGKKRVPIVRLQGQVKASIDLVPGQSVDLTKQSMMPQIWCDEAVHEFHTVVSFAGYTFLPDKDTHLSFRVDLSKGYVFVTGFGKVRTPKGKTIELNAFKEGLVIGQPAKHR